MSQKLLVMLNKFKDEQTIKDKDVEILVEYPNSLLIRCTEEIQQSLAEAGLEIEHLEQPDAWYDEDVAFTPDSNQVAYYVIKLIGPAKGAWLDTIRIKGGEILEGLPGYALIVSMLPNQAQSLAETETWVEKIMIYGPAYDPDSKIDPSLRENSTAPKKQVEISFFRDIDPTALAEKIHDAGGCVFSQTSQTIIAVVPAALINQLAQEPNVQAILPHAFATPQNNRAAEVMDIPHNRTFGSVLLDGSDQIVAVADTGLDTGDPDNIHLDFKGRIVGKKIKSWKVHPEILKENEKYVKGQMILDDGPGDPASHGTHVAGTILGSGEAATEFNDDEKPRGIAPKARLYFQAIGQIVPEWKEAGQVADEPSYIPPISRQVMWSIHDGDDLYQLFEDAYADEETGGGGARIHTNSWSRDDLLGGYPHTSKKVDEFMWNHRDMLILFPAGNRGRDNNCDGVIEYPSIGPPGTAKNCLTVGASENERPPGSQPTPGDDSTWGEVLDKHITPNEPLFPCLKRTDHISDSRNHMAPWSGRGSTLGGMIKPDVVAPGTNILSTRSRIFDPTVEGGPGWGELNSKKLYHWFGGTSMSTALVAGAAALIRQYLIQERKHFEKNVKPSGALIKAFLINGAQEMTGELDDERPTGPNHIYGFGRINLAASFSDEAFHNIHFVDDPNQAVKSQESRNYEVRVADTKQPLRVTLVWTDRPNKVRALGKLGPDLQNKLHLSIRESDGPLIANDTPDNNVQRIIIEEPKGTYKIRVHCKEIKESSPIASCKNCQDFALVVSNVTHLTPVNEF